MPGEAFSSRIHRASPNGTGLALHAALIAAGWNFLYGDANAMLGGSAGNPGWGRSFVGGGSAGIVIYRMPARDSLSAWYIQIELLFAGSGGSTAVSFIRVQTGTGWDGVSALTGADGAVTISDGFAYSGANASRIYVAATRDGFAVGQGATANVIGIWHVHIERCRNNQDVVIDELITHISSTGNNTSGLVSEVGSQTAWCRRRTPSAIFNWRVPLLLLAHTGGASGSIDRTDGSAFTAVGPYLHSNADPFLPRLLLLGTASDVGDGSTQTMVRDGATRTYYAIGGGIYNARLMFAQSG